MPCTLSLLFPGGNAITGCWLGHSQDTEQPPHPEDSACCLFIAPPTSLSPVYASWGRLWWRVKTVWWARVFIFAKMFNPQQFWQVSAASLLPVYHHLRSVHIPREILQYFFPQYQLPSELGYTSVEELAASFEVSQLCWNFEGMTE